MSRDDDTRAPQLQADGALVGSSGLCDRDQTALENLQRAAESFAEILRATNILS